MRLRLVPAERRFYPLFQGLAELVAESLVELDGVLNGETAGTGRLGDLERRCDELTHQIYRLIHSTFITPIDREDLQELALALDDVVDLAEEVGDKLQLYRIREAPEPARRSAGLLALAGAEVSGAVAGLDGFRGLAQHRIEIHRLENQADAVNREGLASLFEGALPAADLIKWKDIYELLERAMNRCEEIANLLESIAIKSA